MSVGAAPAASAGASAGASSGVASAGAVGASASAGAVSGIGGGGGGALPAAYSISFGGHSGISSTASAYGMNPANLQSQIDSQNKEFDKNSPLMQAIAAAMLHKQAFG